LGGVEKTTNHVAADRGAREPWTTHVRAPIEDDGAVGKDDEVVDGTPMFARTTLEDEHRIGWQFVSRCGLLGLRVSAAAQQHRASGDPRQDALS
jgi:hypothetical protein